MASLKANRTIVVIRNDLGETFGTARITYDKDYSDEIWENRNNAGWVRVQDPSSLDPQSDSPEFGGTYKIKIEAGKSYQAGIFVANAGPPDPQQKADIKIFGIFKDPQKKNLITGNWNEAGGTFVRQFIQTSEKTAIAAIGAKRSGFDVDSNGIPVFEGAEGVASFPTLQTGHDMFLMPFLPGNDYELKAVVVDDFGNWDILTTDFRTQSRKFTVQFTTLHIYNDSDPGSHGEAEFKFMVMFGVTPGHTRMIQEFRLPEMDIDDWSKTDRPYPVGFAHVGDFVSVAEDERDVSVWSVGTEFDGLDPDEGAWASIVDLGFPIGLREQVDRRQFRLNATPSTKGSDFRYGVDVVWSVEYEPRP